MKKVNKPNILFLCVDQWPGKLLGCAGHPEIETPTIDRLAASGVQFTRAYAETPICIPARRSIMTGTSPRAHGIECFNQLYLCLMAFQHYNKFFETVDIRQTPLVKFMIILNEIELVLMMLSYMRKVVQI